ncbi:hypothetical protein M408DRAFT_9390 [Serendipita vermifera MAFF 305830]|uniref:NmrA-like domain-containing protein n=1 Tax=Serendipita vermifera MAFF 305830 TaxID=933852 RepID=A0A0C2XDQ3_SERVB|nr:hypothetical protein M408DRAFT_9390 [Serendipita vermifera MAFF 305830]
MAFTKAAVIGARGNLGKHFMQSLLASSEPKFQIIVLARASSGYAPPADHVEVFKQDLTDHTMMVNSLRGADVLVLMQGMDRDFVTVSKAAIEAAIEAGVKMVIPSDYGGHHTPTQATAFPFQPQVNQFVKEKAEEGKITYTIVKNGTFFGLRKY